MKIKKTLTNIIIPALTLGSVVLNSCDNNAKQDLSNLPINKEIKKEIIVPEDSIAKYDPIFKNVIYESKLDKKENCLVYVSDDLDDGSFNVLPAYKSLYKQGIFPTIANSYSKRGNYVDIHNGLVWLAGNNISPNLEKQYSSRFELDEVADLIMNNVPAEKANQYNESFSNLEIISLFKDTISPKQANSLKDFHASRIIFSKNELKKLNLPLEIIKDYSYVYVDQKGYRVFEVNEIIDFVKNKISPETINRYIKLGDKYGQHLSGKDMLDFEKRGIPFEKVKEKCLERYVNSKIK